MGSPFPVPITSPGPVTLKVTWLSVTGTIPSLGVLYFDGPDGDVPPVRRASPPIGPQDQLGRGTCSLALGSHDLVALLVTTSFDLARRVLQDPGQVLVFLHVLRAQALAWVVEQFHPVHVGVNPDRDVLSFEAGPVPVWGEHGAPAGWSTTTGSSRKSSFGNPHVSMMPYCELMLGHRYGDGSPR